MDINAPAQIITALAQLITAPHLSTYDWGCRVYGLVFSSLQFCLTFDWLVKADESDDFLFCFQKSCLANENVARFRPLLDLFLEDFVEFVDVALSHLPQPEM